MAEKLLGKTLEELKTLVSDLGLPSFSAKQIADWLYKKRVTDIDSMTNISQKNRELLKSNYEIGLHEPIKEAISKDGTKKYLFRTDNGLIESVYIPEEDRATLCVSCQVGCKMNCSFCSTGKMGFHGHLDSADIINQVLSIPDSSKLTNIVYMGMGEPMDNLTNVLKSIDILTKEYGLAWSPKRITVSTVGIIPAMRIFLKESQCHIAVSLHNPISAERAAIMPTEKAYPINDIVAELRKYDFSHQRRVSFEYTLIQNVNNTMRHAAALVRLLKGFECRVNIIRYHQSANTELKRADNDSAIVFRDYLNDNGITATIRKSRGEDIDAACGLLSTKESEQL